MANKDKFFVVTLTALLLKFYLRVKKKLWKLFDFLNSMHLAMLLLARANNLSFESDKRGFTTDKRGFTTVIINHQADFYAQLMGLLSAEKWRTKYKGKKNYIFKAKSLAIVIFSVACSLLIVF